MVGAALFISLFAFLIFNVPVGIAIGMSSVVAVLVHGGLSLPFVAQGLVTGTDSFTILAIPLFILAGDLMSKGGVSMRILNVCNVLFGRMTGGLAVVVVTFCMFFSAVTGSATATVAAVGSMVVPTMLQKGYSKSFSLALVATAGGIGIIIPPSIPMVIYGVATQTSIGSLFMAGFIPGMLMGALLITFSYVYCKKQGWKGTDEPFSWRKTIDAIWDAKWALLNPVIILGGIYGGIFTPTEAAAVAVIYSFVCGVFLYRELDLKSLIFTMGNTCSTIGVVMIILGCATAFARILTLEQIPIATANFITGISQSPFIVMLLINILLLIMGTFMDSAPSMLIFGPILMPVAALMGVHPVHFGIIMTINKAIGFLTPPLGTSLFVAAQIGEVNLEVVLKGVMPFLLVMLIYLMIITYVAPISMFLPVLLN